MNLYDNVFGSSIPVIVVTIDPNINIASFVADIKEIESSCLGLTQRLWDRGSEVQMSVYVIDDVLSQEVSESIENIVRSMNYRWVVKPHMST